MGRITAPWAKAFSTASATTSGVETVGEPQYWQFPESVNRALQFWQM